MNWLQKRARPVFMTRNRPYKKDDNAHVEQKNWTHIRQWFGYERHDNPAVVEPINKLSKDPTSNCSTTFTAVLNWRARKERTGGSGGYMARPKRRWRGCWPALSAGGQSQPLGVESKPASLRKIISRRSRKAGTLADESSQSQQQSILTLHKAGWSNRAIARELHLNRETVAKYLRSQGAPIANPSGAQPPARKAEVREEQI